MKRAIRALCLIVFAGTFACLILRPELSFAQLEGHNFDKNTSRYLYPDEMDKILNSAFSNLITSNKNPAEISSNASLDPVAASFSLKASFPLRFGKKPPDTTVALLENTRGSFSYLGFSASGNLLDKSYATLFSKGALNSGISAQMQYNFKLGERGSLSAVEAGNAILKRDLLNKTDHDRAKALDQAFDASNYENRVVQLRVQLEADETRLEAAKDTSALLARLLDSLGWHVKGKPELADQYVAAQKKIMDQTQALGKTKETLDSLQTAARLYWGAVYDDKRHKLRLQIRKDFDSTIEATPLDQVSVTWCTLSSGIGKKSFYTFDPTQPFSSQVNSNSLTTFNFGFSLNYMKIDHARNYTLFLNSTISYLRDNNLSSLSTSELDQTKKTANAAGDTTRMVTTKFNVYTSPITTYLATNWTGQAYYIWNKQPLGLHLSPSMTFEDNGLTISNLTLGFIFGFKTSNKDQPILNTELYVTGQDIFNQQKSTTGLWKRSQIGLSFTVPVNLFMK